MIHRSVLMQKKKKKIEEIILWKIQSTRLKISEKAAKVQRRTLKYLQQKLLL